MRSRLSAARTTGVRRRTVTGGAGAGLTFSIFCCCRTRVTATPAAAPESEAARLSRVARECLWLGIAAACARDAHIGDIGVVVTAHAHAHGRAPSLRTSPHLPCFRPSAPSPSFLRPPPATTPPCPVAPVSSEGKQAPYESACGYSALNPADGSSKPLEVDAKMHISSFVRRVQRLLLAARRGARQHPACAGWAGRVLKYSLYPARLQPQGAGVPIRVYPISVPSMYPGPCPWQVLGRA